jgi:HK97 family phage major capsid protein
MKKRNQTRNIKTTEPTTTDDMIYRNAEFIRESLNKDKREIELSFSSEDPVERYDYSDEEFYQEVLDHQPGSVRLERINKGGALLLDHDRSTQIGVTVRAWIDEVGRKGRAIVRFGKSNKAAEIYNDVVDEIRQNVSVGYRLLGKPVKSVESEKTVYRFKDWEPQEISIVSVPADATVGVGRSKPKIKITKEPTMTPEEIKALEEKARAEGAKSAEAKHQVEEKRKTDILEIAEAHNLTDLGREYIAANRSVEDFRAGVLEKIRTQPTPQPKTEIGMSDRETQTYNILDVIRAQIPGISDTPGIGLVKEASAAIAKALKKEPSGLFVPNEVQNRSLATHEKRDLSVGTDTAGGYTVATDMNGFIDLLRNKMVLQSAGATVMDGLVGDVAIPRHSAAGTAYWISSEAGAITESSQTFEQVTLTPKTVGAFTDLTRKLINQSSIDIQNFVTDDLSRILAIAIDLAGFTGSGAAGQPTGITNVSGIGSVTWATASTPTWLEIIGLESAVAVDNALSGSLSYIAGGTMRGVLKGVAKDSGAGLFAWTGNEMNGYPAHLSNQVTTDDVYFGNWSDLIIGFWNTLEILVDPFTGSTTGNVRVRAMKDVDLATRHAESFALGSD